MAALRTEVNVQMDNEGTCGRDRLKLWTQQHSYQSTEITGAVDIVLCGEHEGENDGEGGVVNRNEAGTEGGADKGSQ